ncbi:hypothetical protein M6B38_255535 [Iris pallida]|uniref:Four helix bundle protein n=1 Tax=Iris pallida TaxID=29817 RepID=A0AAX6IGL8_IRIPA|nr:hypothetical protein M6B38_255535 [Iris pallida]
MIFHRRNQLDSEILWFELLNRCLEICSKEAFELRKNIRLGSI